jgi:hypothetical protein
MSVSPEIRHFPVLKGSGLLKAAASEGDRASQRGTGGVSGRGGPEEDHPATWETHDLPPAEAGWGPARNTPTRRAVDACPAGTEKRPSGGRHAKGRPEVVLPQPERVGAGLAEEAWESDGRIRAMKVGNGRHPDPAEQRRPVPRENIWRET